MPPAHGFPHTTRFVLERQLGAGGMGVVYLAYDPEQRSRVAADDWMQSQSIVNPERMASMLAPGFRS